MASGDHWERLASYVIARRIELGFRDRGAFAAAARVTPRTLGKLETGRPVSAPTLAAVELALKWEPGSTRRILAGDDPEVLREPGSPAPLMDMTEEERLLVLAYRSMRRGSERAG